MKDKFEISVQNAANGYKVHLTRKDAVWKGIEQKLQKKRIRSLIIKLSAAAVIAVMITSGAFIFTRYEKKPKGYEYYCSVVNELEQTKMYYAGLIETKQNEIKSEDFDNEELFRPFFDEMQRLDEQYHEYMKQLNQYGPQEEIIRAMILNLQQKYDILEKLLLKIKKIKNYENRKKTYSI